MALYQCKKCGQYVCIQSTNDQQEHEKVCKSDIKLMQKNGYIRELEVNRIFNFLTGR